MPQMIRATLLLFVVAWTLPAQTADTQLLRAVLDELRQLRQDLFSVTLVAQRVQILLYRVQLQDDIAKKATARYDQAAAKLRDADRAYAEAVSALKKMEDRLGALQSPKEKAEGEEMVREMKRRVEMWSQDQSAYRAAEITAASELKTEQSKLAELQQRLELMEKQLERSPGR